jgi:hypothetical protein
MVVHLTEDPPENFCRPSVDVLFRNVASAYGDRVLAVVLTGMGRDGEKGAKAIRDAGGEVVAQDEATSVVWGMPGAVTTAGQADKVLPLPRIGPETAAALSRGPAPVGVTSRHWSGNAARSTCSRARSTWSSPGWPRSPGRSANGTWPGWSAGCAAATTHSATPSSTP